MHIRNHFGVWFILIRALLFKYHKCRATSLILGILFKSWFNIIKRLYHGNVIPKFSQSIAFAYVDKIKTHITERIITYYNCLSIITR